MEEYGTETTSRFEDRASQMMKIMIRTAVREMNDPIDDTMFHVV